MSNRVNFSLVSVVCLSFLPMYACSNGGGDESSTFGSFGTTQTTFTTTMSMEEEESGNDSTETGDGDGDPTTTMDTGDGDPTTTMGDGDGDSGDGDGDTDCPLGEFGCPCDNGQCAPGLACGVDNTCGLGGGDGDGDPTTGDGDGDPWDPAACAMPSQSVMVTDIEGSFCSAPCTVDGDCPAGPGGTNPACLLLLDPNDVDPSGCVLICDPAADTCPAGSTCKDVPDQPGIGVCTYP